MLRDLVANETSRSFHSPPVPVRRHLIPSLAGGDESADAATRSAFVEVAGERLPFGLCVREVCAGYSTAVAALASALLVFADK